MRAFRHPIVLASIAVWILNDHLLKAALPGVVSGKLSDVAGMIVTPLLVLAIVELVTPSAWRSSPRFRLVPWAAAIAVGAAFAAAKTWAPANELYCWVFEAVRLPLRAMLSQIYGLGWREHIHLVRDPTDLVAVPFGAVAAWIATRERPEAKPA